VREGGDGRGAGDSLRRSRRHSIDGKAPIKKPVEPDFTVEEED